jgi:antibiotic biosynthesis monooxygenase (ABM) superfamily enzyme
LPSTVVVVPDYLGIDQHGWRADASATAISIFHPPADPRRFAAWVSDYVACARAADGFAGARVSVQSDGHLDWGVAVTFRNADALDDWLDSSARKSVLADGEGLGHFRRATDLVIAERELPPGVAAFRHSVTPGKETDFVAGQAHIAANAASFPGAEGTVLFPPDASGQWMSVLRFRAAHQLMAWLRSHEREEALPQLRAHLTRNFSELPRSAPFGSTVRTDNGQTRITPAWKTAMLVLLCLYPMVMVLSRFLGPPLHRLGAGPWLTVFLSNVTSVALLQWVLVPALSRPFRRWLDPVEGVGVRISLVGATVVGLGYFAALLLFAFVKWLQFWDYPD